MAQQSSTTHSAECVVISYPDAPDEIVCFCEVSSFDAAVLDAAMVRPRGARTSSGWCEACEDGIISRCKRGGCY